MYHPVLNASRAELNGVIDSLADLIRNGRIVPVFMPTKEFGLRLIQRGLLGTGLPLYVIANPHHGPHHGVALPAVGRSILNDPSVTPVLRVTSRTTPAGIAAFARQHGRCAYFLHEAVSAHIETAIAGTNPTMVFARRRRGGPLHSASPIAALGRSRNCDIGDYFQKQNSSALYPAETDFSNRHITIGSDRDFGHFGDFSVIGDTYSEGGSQPYAIAVHRIFCNGGYRRAPLKVAHYVSRRNRTIRGDTAGKVQEACVHLMADDGRIASLERRNATAAIANFSFYANPANRTNAEMMKRLAIKHHLLLMCAIL